jgi:hypothetical protein
VEEGVGAGCVVGIEVEVWRGVGGIELRDGLLLLCSIG